MSTFRDHLLAITGRELPTIEQLWEMTGFSPNDAQRQAILHVEGPLYLTAGPGSGKTRVLLWRTLNLMVYHGVKAEQIFLSTFTEKAAKQLGDGLRSLLGLVTNLTGQPYDLAGMYLGTVHSLCQRILSDRRRFSPNRQRPRPPTLLDDLGQYFHLYDSQNWEIVASAAGLRPEPEEAVQAVNRLLNDADSGSRHRAVEALRPIFNRFSEELLDPADLRPRLNSLQLDGFTPQNVDFLLALYEGYRHSLQHTRQTDFALLQREAFQVLQEFESAGAVFRHVIVDEYQDTNTIQERIFFRLASGTGNLCVVGDDDQALYRFRGATVENFVQFPARCQTYLAQTPRTIALDINYRSRAHIVQTYNRFMAQTDWRAAEGTTFRVPKTIIPHRADPSPAVLSSAPAAPEDACREIARFVRRLIDEGKVENPNQIAFLYPSLKSEQTRRMIAALEAEGLLVYAPRAGRFLEVDEARDVLGLFLAIFGRPRIEGMGHDLEAYQIYLTRLNERARELQETDPLLKQFVDDRRAEIQRALDDYKALQNVLTHNRWRPEQPYDPAAMKRALAAAPGLSETGRRLVSSVYLDRLVPLRAREGRPLSLEYVIRRATSLDWNLLDLFYQLMGFEHFKAMFDRAERNGDEGAVANLGLLTQYLARFVQERVNVITAALLNDHKFSGMFFGSYLFALFRLEESEREDEENPFPRGRIPFLTIHQAKGLEFPVVVLGNLDKRDRGAPRIERLVRPLLPRPASEPLERMTAFDIARMFYVALSRAQNLLILAHFSGRGQRHHSAFTPLLNEHVTRLADFDLATLPPAAARDETLPRVYSFTADYLLYQKCPRQYMIFRKFGFVPSRSQTMLFGSLVHRTLEDLHHELIRRRAATASPPKKDDR
ncbi:MAG: ATP-dependent helicase [Anaerolineales bacterium]|nr:ATP-dependent helicase [Anaerolineales bacterium]